MPKVLIDRIEEIINGYGYHVYPVDTEGENVYTIDNVIEKLTNKSKT